jgi:hypothetical protein
MHPQQPEQRKLWTNGRSHDLMNDLKNNPWLVCRLLDNTPAGLRVSALALQTQCLARKFNAIDQNI